VISLEPSVEKVNVDVKLNADQIRDLYAEDILEMQQKMVGVINDLEEVDEEQFESKGSKGDIIGVEFVSNPDVSLEEQKNINNEEENKGNEEVKQDVNNDRKFLFSKI
jgi:hypothetical protein